MTSSERRLHPSSVFFALTGEFRSLLGPGILVFITANAAGRGWDTWLLWLLVPYTALAVGRYLTFRYRYDAEDLVIRSGFIFRNERHIPYSRIQNVDSVQNVLHRLVGVVVVRVHTGGTSEVEATLSVLPAAALDEMRQRVLESRRSAVVAEAGPSAPANDRSDPTQATPAGGSDEREVSVPATAATTAFAPPARTLLHLSWREILIAGIIHNYGAVLVAAGIGLLWELGLGERAISAFFGRTTWGGGVIRDLVRAFFTGAPIPVSRVGVLLGAILVFLLLLRLVSIVIGIIRLHGFTLSRGGEELRTEFGLFTRVSATIPLRRVQSLSIAEGPWHRRFGRVSVSVSTAGSGGGEGSGPGREAIAPIVAVGEAAALVSQVMPGVEIDELPWHPVEARAVRREFVQALVVLLPLTAPFTWRFGWWSVAVAAGLVAWAALLASRQVRAMRWAMTDEVVAYRSGWIWRHLTIVRFSRVQVVSLAESPFDRRAVMASVRVDTAGATAHPVSIPYLARAEAEALHATVTSRVAETRFAW